MRSEGRPGTPSFLPMLMLCLLSAVLPAGTWAPATAAAATPEEAGWDFLLDNRLARAESAFREALAADKDSGAAHRGLLVALACQGRDDMLEAALREYTRHAKGEPADYYLVEFLYRSTTMGTTSYIRSLYEFTDRISKRSGLHVLDRRLFQEQAMLFAQLSGMVARTADMRESLGRIHHWAMLGPFDNTSGAGVRRQYLESCNPDTVGHTGKQELPIKWFFPQCVGLDGSVTPSRHFHLKEDTTAYLRTVIDVPDAGAYLLSCGYAGDIEIHIDQARLLQGRRTGGGGESAHWRLDLPAGSHELAVKLSSGKTPGWLACSITNEAGAPVPGQPAPRRIFTPATGSPPSPSPLAAPLTNAVGSVSPAESAGEAIFWRLQQSLHIQAAGEMAVAQAALDQYANSGLLHWAAAQIAEAFGERDKSRLWSARALKLADDLAPVVLAEAETQVEAHRFDLAAAAADRILAAAPACRWALSLKLRCLGEEGRSAAQAELAAQVAAMLPDDALGFLFQAAAAEALGETRKAARWRLQALALLPPGSRQLVALAAEMGHEDYLEASTRLNELTALAPDIEEFWIGYFHALIATDSAREAQVVLHRIASSFPQNTRMLMLESQLAQAGYGLFAADYDALFPPGGVELTEAEFGAIFPSARYEPGRRITFPDDESRERYLRMICEREAAAYLEKALAVEPGDFEIRNLMRKLRGQPDLQTYLPDVEPDEFIARRIDPAVRPEANSLMLVDWRRRFVYDGQASQMDRLMVVEVLNQAGIAEWENQVIPYNPYLNEFKLVKCLTVKRDGKRTDADVTGANIVFRKLEPGDVIVLHYRLSYRHIASLTGQFWDHHVFGYDDPCLESRFTLIMPTNSQPQWRVLNDGPTSPLAATTRAIDADYRSLEWSRADIPANSREPLAPGPRQYVPWVDVSSIVSWPLVSAWYASLADGQTEPSPGILETARRLTADCTDENGRYDAIYRFVSDRITYESVPLLQTAFIPRVADEVLDSRFGDCKDKSALMVAMLRAVGVTSACIALTTPWTEGGEPFLPSPRFNHAVVGRRLPNGAMAWYDPTVAHAPPGRVPSSIAGSPALPATPQGAELVTIGDPWQVETVCDSSQKLLLRADGYARLERSTTYSGADDVSTLSGFLASHSRAEIETELLLQVAGHYAGATLESLAYPDPDSSGPALVVTDVYGIPSCFPASGSLLTGTIPADDDLVDLLGRIVALPQRDSALDLRLVATHRRARLTVLYPPGFKLLAVPDGVSAAAPGFVFTVTYRASPTQLVAEWELKVDGVVADVAVYPSLKAAVESALRGLRAPLVLQKSG